MKQSFFFFSSINLCIIIFFSHIRNLICCGLSLAKLQCPQGLCGQNISFPFFISGQQQLYCGFPGFQLNCIDNEEDGYATLQLAGDTYFVHNISYQDQTVVVSNAALSYSNTSALAGRTSASVLALPGDQQQLLANVSDKCGSEVVVTPVEDYATNNELDVEKILRRWLASDCSKCRKSGGKCGFDFELYHFRSFCPDRPHRVSCASEEIASSLKLGLGLGAAGLVLLVLSVVCCFRRKLSDKSVFIWMNKNHSREIIQKFLKDHGPLQIKRYSYLSLQLPPKPYLCSPPISHAVGDSSTKLVSLQHHYVKAL